MTQDHTTVDYGYVRAAAVPFNEAVEQMETALKAEGFGVLCNIDIQAKLKEKLGVETPKYVILGACNPPLAQQALAAEVNLGLLLPCNAVVYENGGRVYVGAIDAVKMLSIVGNPQMEDVARQVTDRLRRAVDAVAAGASLPAR